MRMPLSIQDKNNTFLKLNRRDAVSFLMPLAMPGYKRNVLDSQRRDVRRETAAGIAGQNENVLELQQRGTRRKTAAGNAEKN
jgi:hypothetical protein